MIAYFILVHRYPEQFERLFKSIYSSENYYLLHVDKRSGKDLFVKIQEMVKQYPNVAILKSQNVVWGGYSMVNVELRAMKKLLQLTKKWEYFINLSGQDFPLHSQKYIKQYLSIHAGKSFMTYANQETDRPTTMNRIRNYYVESANGFIGKPIPRNYMDKITPYIGGQWKILTRECCEFVTHTANVKKFIEYYSNTLIPDESFFQTVLMNTNYKGLLINDHKRAIIWIPDMPRNKSSKNTHTTQKLIESGKIKLRPKTFTVKDKEFLLKSNALFARKFDQTIDSNILTILEKRVMEIESIKLDQNTTNAPLYEKPFLQLGLAR